MNGRYSVNLCGDDDYKQPFKYTNNEKAKLLLTNIYKY